MRSKIGKRLFAGLMSVLLTVSMIPMDFAGSSVVAKGADYTNDDKKVGTLTVSEWVANERTSTWVFNDTNNIDTTTNLNFADGDTANGIKVTKGGSPCIKYDGSGLSIKPVDKLSIPVSKETTSAVLTIAVSSTNSNRYVVAGGKKAYMSAGNGSYVVGTDITFDSNKSATYTLDSSTITGLGTDAACIEVCSGTTGSSDSGEAKIASITLVETRTSGTSVEVKVSYDSAEVFSLAGSLSDEGVYSVTTSITAGTAKLQFTEEPVVGKLSAVAGGSDAVTGAAYKCSLDTANKKVIIYNDVDGNDTAYADEILKEVEYIVVGAATVSGTTSASVSGGQLKFTDVEDSSNTQTATINPDGTYTVFLNTGCKYDVQLENKAGYRLDGANGSGEVEGIMSLDLMETSAGANVSGMDFPVVYYDATKSGKVTIGDTTFVVKAPSAEHGVFNVSAEAGAGNVEIAGAEKAVVWASLGGKDLSSVANAGDGVGSVSVNGKKVTVKFADQTSNPKSYVLEVRDGSLATEPIKDGMVNVYDFTDESIVSALYDGTAAKLTGGSSIESEDTIATLVGNSSVYYHSKQYGIAMNPDDEIKIKVAGDAGIEIKVASFGTTGIAASADNGTVYVSGDDTKAVNTVDTSNCNPGVFSFNYEGAATTVTLKMTGGTSYVAYVSSQNKADEAVKHPEKVKAVPSVTNMPQGNLEVQEVGQTLVLTQTSSMGLSVATPKDSGVSFYMFPAIADYCTLEADIVITPKSGANNNNAFMTGFINCMESSSEKWRVMTTAVRANKDVVMLYSKNDKEAFGKSSNTSVAAAEGEKLHVKITRSDDGLTLETVNSEGKSAPKTMKYDPLYAADSSVALSYGFVLNNVSATVTNMVYSKVDGTVLYDQNEYYEPMGTAPVATSVTAVAAADRTKIDVTWNGDTASMNGKYVLQVKKPGSNQWEDVDTELTSNSYEYLVSSDDSGTYKFRVCGTLGNSVSQNIANRNAYVESNEATIIAALSKPVVTLPYTSPANQVSLTWTPSAGATRYEVYRKSSDEAEMTKIADVTTTSYVDNTVQAEVPYYYYVKGFSEDNFGNFSDEVWTLPTNGHSGDYDENVALAITKRSYNTVFEDKITLEGVVGAAGTVSVSVNGTVQQTATVSSANGTFAFDNNITLAEGRNDVVLTLDYAGGTIRKSLNYVYLTNYDYVVDAGFTGTAGDTSDYGVPEYSTVEQALTAIGTSNSSKKVVLVRNGEYNEKLTVNEPNVSLIGEDSEKTVICYDVGADAGGSGTVRYTMTVAKSADNFTAENICIRSDYDYKGDGSKSNESAEALYCETGNAQFVGVRLLGYQDTLQVKNGTQTFYKCYIAGNVDFMWGVTCNTLFDDCDLVMRYNANKNSGYYTAFGKDTNIVYRNCRFTSESACGGSKYYLGRPYNNQCNILFANCYMGGLINKEWGYANWSGQELSGDPEIFAASKFFECGSYGTGYEVNKNRRQISQAAADTRIASLSGGYTAVDTLGESYKGTMSTTANTGFVTSTYTSDKYSQYEGDDTGLGKYNLEGYASAASATGGGLLKENNANYYKVANASEFLTALKKIRATKGSPSVIEVTADLNLGYNEAGGAEFNDTNIIASHNPALLSPTLIASGVSKIYLKEISNLTIFSKNGATIKHAALDISNSKNIIIRNLQFDELWEWDEETSGDYDVNDWDYMTIENGSSRVWVDHCTFYKSYDGVVDIKTTDAYAAEMDITVSWCKFMPGSKNNTFFDAMMDMMAANPSAYPYYQSLLDSGMSKEQIRMYAYGQKKTHLLGQNDDASANKNLKVTFANNYYFDSMDRMPRLRFGTAHVYNCVMDAQELYDARKSITNADAAKHIVSNGAASTCGGSVLLENCYINGITNALNSGNGSSPSGYINAINSLYYMSGVRYKLEPKVNTTKYGEPLLVTDAASFKSDLPYGNYALYDAASLSSVVVPYTGAGVLNLTTAQWEKASYNDTTWKVPTESGSYNNNGLPEFIDTENGGNNGGNTGGGIIGGDDSDDIFDDDYSSDDSYDSDDFDEDVQFDITVTENGTGTPESGLEIPQGAISFTDEERREIADGAKVNIDMKVENIGESVKESDVTVINAAISKLMKAIQTAGINSNIMDAASNAVLGTISKSDVPFNIGMYMDIKLTKTVGSLGSKNITRTDKKVTVTVDVPAELLNTRADVAREYLVVRVHDGSATVLPTKFDPSTGKLTFESDRFSTYAIIYRDVPATYVAQNSPVTGDAASMGLYVFLMMASVAVLGAPLGIKRKKRA